MLPVLEELNGLLFYPVQYEGEESSKNVFYTGAAPNQQAIPSVDCYLNELGEIRADGPFDIISQTEPVAGDAWTDFLPESAVLEADWKDLKCGMSNTQTKTCVQLTSN